MVTLLLLLAAAFAFVLRPSIRGHDGVLNYAYLRSTLLDRDLDFTNDYDYYLKRQGEWFNNEDLPRDPVTNKPINLYGVGSSILWAPWVLIAHSYCLLTQYRPDSWPADGYSFPYEAAVGTGSCFYASIGVVLVALTLRRRFGRKAGLWASLAVWLATPLFFYMYLHPSMSHANSFFLSALLLWLYLNGDGLGRWAMMGGVAGLLAATRFQDAVLLAGIAVGEAWRALESRRETGFLARRILRYVLAATIAIIAFAPQMIAWHILQGSALSGPRAYLMQGTVRLWAPIHAFEVLFSPRHGAFYWHPMLLLAFAGLLVSRRRPRLRLVCIAMFAAELWVIASWSIWWAGASFGHRLFISVLPAFAVGAAFLFRASSLTRALTPALILFFILWNFGYVVQYGSGMITRQGPVSIDTLARNNLVHVPKLLMGRKPVTDPSK